MPDTTEENIPAQAGGATQIPQAGNEAAQLPTTTVQAVEAAGAAEAAYHFTYQRPSCNDLQQGDLIRKESALAQVLESVHPHYGKKEDYTHLLVLTQTCDLVRRDGQMCKARYISLAAVRPVSLAIQRELEKHQDEFERVGVLCSNANRPKMEQFIDRLLNNNEGDYFYLNTDVAHGLDESSCAFLRLSVALRTREHYAKILSARVLSLAEVFQAKLGWLMGNMYSRVGTQDWVPEHVDAKQFTKLRSSILAENCRWEEPDKLRLAKEMVPVGTDFTHLQRDAIRKIVDGAKVKKRKEQIIDAVVQLLAAEEVIANDDKTTTRVRMMLKNDPELAKYIK